MIADQMIFSKKIAKQSFEEDKSSEKPVRSIAKALSWRIVGTLDTLVVSYFVTGKIFLLEMMGLQFQFNSLLGKHFKYFFIQLY